MVPSQTYSNICAKYGGGEKSQTMLEKRHQYKIYKKVAFVGNRPFFCLLWFFHATSKIGGGGVIGHLAAPLRQLMFKKELS